MNSAGSEEGLVASSCEHGFHRTRAISSLSEETEPFEEWLYPGSTLVT
jgi:hypothetical protein